MIQLAAPSPTTRWINRRIVAASRSSIGTQRRRGRRTANGTPSATIRSQATTDVLMIRLTTVWNVSVPEKTSPWSRTAGNYRPQQSRHKPPAVRHRPPASAASPSRMVRLQQLMYRERDGHSTQENAAKWRRHLPKRANSTVASQEGGSLAEAARRLHRIVQHGGELANGTLCRIAQCGKPMGHRPHLRRLASRHQNIRNRHLFPRRLALSGSTSSGRFNEENAADRLRLLPPRHDQRVE